MFEREIQSHKMVKSLCENVVVLPMTQKFV